MLCLNELVTIRQLTCVSVMPYPVQMAGAEANQEGRGREGEEEGRNNLKMLHSCSKSREKKLLPDPDWHSKHQVQPQNRGKIKAIISDTKIENERFVCECQL